MGLGKWLINLTLWCVVTEVLRSIRCNIYVHIYCCPQQALPQHYKWDCVNNGRDSAHDRTCYCYIVVRLLTGKQCLGRKFCLRRYARSCVGWAWRRYTAHEEHVET
jgi:hypothetical protein